MTYDTVLSMNKRINIAEKEKAIEDLNQFSMKHYQSTDVEFFNVHLKLINDVCNVKIFDKNNLFVRSSTLSELMQPEGFKGKHNHHGLSASEIYLTLKSLSTPFAVYYSREARIVVCSNVANTRNEKIQVVVELHAGLENNRFANINKIVSIYPKRNILNKLDSLNEDLLIYKK